MASIDPQCPRNRAENRHESGISATKLGLVALSCEVSFSPSYDVVPTAEPRQGSVEHSIQISYLRCTSPCFLEDGEFQPLASPLSHIVQCAKLRLPRKLCSTWRHMQVRGKASAHGRNDPFTTGPELDRCFSRFSLGLLLFLLKNCQ